MGEFDVIGFLSAGRDNAAVVIFLAMTLTYIAGRLGAKGRVQMIVAMVLGALLGGTFQAASLGAPGDYAGWFWLVIYALVMAVMPVLAYDLGKEFATKAGIYAAERTSATIAPGPMGRD